MWVSAAMSIVPSGFMVGAWQPAQVVRSVPWYGCEPPGGTPWQPAHCMPVLDQAGEVPVPWQ